VLILSETAGSAAELGEAVQVNVNSKTEIAEALAAAFNMKPEAQARRMRLMRRRLAEYDLYYWTGSFVEALEQVKKQQSGLQVKRLSEDDAADMRRDYQASGERLLLIDYDGTLVPFSDRPEQAYPDPELIRLLRALGKAPGNRVVIVSGRDRGTLDAWLGNCTCALVAEHGAWIKAAPGGDWAARAPAEVTWKSEIRPILKTFEARVPGSFVEEKDFGIAWHHRRAEPEFGNLRADELYEFLSEYLTHSDLQVLRGNKVIEVRSAGINKGEAALGFLEEKAWDFVLGIGDDWTDEDLFRVLPESAYSIKIGFKSTRARFCLPDSADSRRLLAGFLED
jgi:trehalose 6-phosphate synthase/phosphatase